MAPTSEVRFIVRYSVVPDMKDKIMSLIMILLPESVGESPLAADNVIPPSSSSYYLLHKGLKIVLSALFL